MLQQKDMSDERHRRHPNWHGDLASKDHVTVEDIGIFGESCQYKEQGLSIDLVRVDLAQGDDGVDIPIEGLGNADVKATECRRPKLFIVPRDQNPFRESKTDLYTFWAPAGPKGNPFIRGRFVGWCWKDFFAANCEVAKDHHFMRDGDCYMPIELLLSYEEFQYASEKSYSLDLSYPDPGLPGWPA
jgi:hypothetical protein